MHPRLCHAMLISMSKDLTPTSAWRSIPGRNLDGLGSSAGQRARLARSTPDPSWAIMGHYGPSWEGQVPLVDVLPSNSHAPYGAS